MPGDERGPEVGISLLADDCASYNSVGILAEHGLSALVEFGGQRVLFDTGQSWVYARNAKAMKVDLNSVSMLVISHGHYDHTGGLPRFLRIGKENRVLVAHPDAFETKVTKNGRKVGCPIPLEVVARSFRVRLMERTRRIAKGVYFLTGLDRRHEDPGTVVFHLRNGRREPDPVLDDSSLVLKTEKGLVIVCGCAHAGMLNIVNEATELLADDIYALAGGFHLLHASDGRIRALLERLRELKVQKIYPCHCTGLRATFRMQTGLGAEKVGCGDRIRI